VGVRLPLFPAEIEKPISSKVFPLTQVRSPNTDLDVEMEHLLLLAADNEEINRWLGENPMILGLMFLVIGLAVGGWGLYEFRSGVAHGKYGHTVKGTQGKILAIVRIVVGAGCILFALYKMVAG
jgi:hypothetical protein